jgi:hypothetical protein
MAEAELTIIGPTYRRKKMWQIMMMGGKPEAVAVTKARVRAILEAHYNIRPSDTSERAQRLRRVTSLADLNGLECCIKVGVERERTDPNTGQVYAARNKIAAFMVPGDRGYITDDAGSLFEDAAPRQQAAQPAQQAQRPAPQAAQKPAPQQPPQQAKAKPAWA